MVSDSIFYVVRTFLFYFCCDFNKYQTERKIGVERIGMNTTKIILNSTEKSNETSVEQNVDTEFMLPDYYPEISKILKCMTEVNILTKQAREGSVEIGGQVSLTMLYADKEDTINSYLHTFPFSKSVDMENVCSDDYVSAILRSEYINSKATAPRKIEIHGSVTLGVSILKNKEYEVLSAIEEENIYSKCCEITTSQPYLPICKSLFLEDEISVGANKQSISKIIRSLGVAKINECKIVSNKAIVKGELYVSLLYCPLQSVKPVLINHVHGFSQIIEADNLSDDCSCKAKATVALLEIHPKTSLDGEVKAVNFEAKVNVEIYAEKCVTTCVVSDAFASLYDSELSVSNLYIRSLTDNLRENYVCKKSLDFTDGSIGEIYDLWCKTAINYATCENYELLIKGIVLIYIICCDRDGKPMYFERSVDYEYRYSLNDSNYKCNPDVDIVAVNFSKNADGGVDIAVELSVMAEIYKITPVKLISDITIKDKLNEKDNDTAITLYFAENERVWDVAKKYKANPQKICCANSIDDFDQRCNKILLIPNS